MWLISATFQTICLREGEGKKRENDRSPTCLPDLSLFSSCGKKTPTKENGGRKRRSFSSLVRAKKCGCQELSIAVIIRHRDGRNKTFSYLQHSQHSDNGTLLWQRPISLSGFQTFFLFAKMTADPNSSPQFIGRCPRINKIWLEPFGFFGKYMSK